jgi:hypothetical protein
MTRLQRNLISSGCVQLSQSQAERQEIQVAHAISNLRCKITGISRTIHDSPAGVITTASTNHLLLTDSREAMRDWPIDAKHRMACLAGRIGAMVQLPSLHVYVVEMGFQHRWHPAIQTPCCSAISCLLAPPPPSRAQMASNGIQ